jgi:hypothetical protein
MVAVLSTPARAEPRRFYLGFALACAAIAFAGFTPTFWAPLASGRLELAPVVGLHAALFFAWILLFVTQTALASTGLFAHHRMLGVAGVLLAASMVAVGVLAALHSYHVHAAAGHADRAGPFLISPLSMMPFFGGAVALAAANVRRPDVHKRLMVLATAVVITPAIARLIQFAAGGMEAIRVPTVERTIFPALVADLLILVAIAHDWRTRGRPQPVYLVGLGLWILLQVGRIPLAHTAWWQATVARLTS